MLRGAGSEDRRQDSLGDDDDDEIVGYSFVSAQSTVIVSSTPTDSLFLRGRAFLRATSATTSNIPLPSSSQQNLQWIAFTSIPDLQSIPGSFQQPSLSVSSDIYQGTSFNITYTTTCSATTHETTPPFGPQINWMLVKSGVYQATDATQGDNVYLAAGLASIDQSQTSVTVNLQHPQSSNITLFSQQPVILVQVQDADSTSTTSSSTLRVRLGNDPNSFTIEVVYQPPPYGMGRATQVGYLVLPVGTYVAGNSNTVIDARSVAKSPNSWFAYGLDQFTTQCGRLISFGSVAASSFSASQCLYPWIDNAATASTYGDQQLLYNYIRPRGVSCPNIITDPIDPITMGVVSWLDTSFCEMVKTSDLGFGIVSTLSVPVPITTAISASGLVILAATGSGLVLAVIGVMVYFYIRTPSPSVIKQQEQVQYPFPAGGPLYPSNQPYGPRY